MPVTAKKATPAKLIATRRTRVSVEGRKTTVEVGDAVPDQLIDHARAHNWARKATSKDDA